MAEEVATPPSDLAELLLVEVLNAVTVRVIVTVFPAALSGGASAGFDSGLVSTAAVSTTPGSSVASGCPYVP